MPIDAKSSEKSFAASNERESGPRLPDSDTDPCRPSSIMGSVRRSAPRASAWARWRGPVLHLVFVGALLGIWWLVAYLRSGRASSSPPRLRVAGHVKTSSVHDGMKGYSGVFLYEHLWASMRRILIASAFAIAVGVPFGLLLGTSKWSRSLWSPE